MKYVEDEEVAEAAYQLHLLKLRRAELMSVLRGLKAEEDAAVKYLRMHTKGQDFEFSDPEGWLMRCQFTDHKRPDIDRDAVKRVFDKLRKIVPTVWIKWIAASVDYVYETYDVEVEQVAVQKPARPRVLRSIK